MRDEQVRTLMLTDILHSRELNREILKGIEKITLIVIPMTNNRCMHTSKQCPVKQKGFYLDLDTIWKTLSIIGINSTNTSCLITLCNRSTPLFNSIIDSTGVVELCSGNVNISKHRYDSMLKCVSYSDMLVIITRNNLIPKPIANIIPLAKALNERIIIVNL